MLKVLVNAPCSKSKEREPSLFVIFRSISFQKNQNIISFSHADAERFNKKMENSRDFD